MWLSKKQKYKNIKEFAEIWIKPFLELFQK